MVIQRLRILVETANSDTDSVSSQGGARQQMTRVDSEVEPAVLSTAPAGT